MDAGVDASATITTASTAATSFRGSLAFPAVYIHLIVPASFISARIADVVSPGASLRNPPPPPTASKRSRVNSLDSRHFHEHVITFRRACGDGLRFFPSFISVPPFFFCFFIIPSSCFWPLFCPIDGNAHNSRAFRFLSSVVPAFRSLFGAGGRPTTRFHLRIQAASRCRPEIKRGERGEGRGADRE